MGENDIDEEIQRIKEERRQKTVEEDKEFKQALEKAHSLHESEHCTSDCSDDEDMAETPAPTRGRGRGRGTRSRGGGQGKGKGGRNTAAIEVDDFNESAKPTRGSTGTRRGRKGAGNASASQQSSIANMFPSTSRKTKAPINEFDDEDVVILDDSDDDMSRTSAKAHHRTNPRQTQRSRKRPKKEINFFVSDEDDEDVKDVEFVNEPPRKSTRRR